MNNKTTIKSNVYRLPNSVWPIQEIKQLEHNAADSLGVTLYELMQRAGQACYELARMQWPTAKYWLILCGHGNNGGDGYVIARLAQSAGIKVFLLACSGNRMLPKEAQQARDAWLSAGGVIHSADIEWPESIDLIVDALLGTGIHNAPTAPYDQLIEMINMHTAPILAVDIPSGLIAANGTTPGVAVIAHHTLSMIVLKPGQLIGKARDHVGRLHYHDLGLSAFLDSANVPIMRYDTQDLRRWFKTRKKTQHKGDNGRLLIVGGDIGMGGAIRMTAEAALRSGAGLVRVLTSESNIVPIITARPELMVDVLSKKLLHQAMDWADVITVGPGLGKRNWGKKALKIISTSKKPMLWDADALNLLSMNPDNRINRIITPHLGEASRLLGIKISDIERDRLHAVQSLAEQYGGVVVLKGAGTMIASMNGEIAIIDVGNAGMASGGMGDVLSGIISALLAQKLTLVEAAYAGCVVHGTTADEIAYQHGTRGILATDLFELIWKFVNPEMLENQTK